MNFEKNLILLWTVLSDKSEEKKKTERFGNAFKALVVCDLSHYLNCIAP